MNKKFIFVINDFFGHGGHIKSFLSQLSSMENEIHNFKIVCSEDGYIIKNINRFSYINNEQLILVPMRHLRKLRFSIRLYSQIKDILMDNDILHIYSSDCYFSALLAKRSFKNVILVHSVMGGPNPFPCLRSTDLYLAVSEEQKDYAISFGYKNANKSNIVIIKNRIIVEADQESLISTNEKIILIISRFDIGIEDSLEKLVSLLRSIPSKYKVIVAGNGELWKKYKDMFNDFSNVYFIGYCSNLMAYKQNTAVVLGMGRSILEFLIQGVPAILIGHNGIEMLDEIEAIKYASKFNFAGRKVLYNHDLKVTVKYISKYMESTHSMKEEIVSYLSEEYLAEYFAHKYLQAISNAEPSGISLLDVSKEYKYIFKLRVKRLFKRYLGNKDRNK